MRNRELYPDNWEEISLNVRNEAKWQCEECGKPCRKPGESVEDFADRISDEWFSELYEMQWNEEIGEYITTEKPIRFCLTVAHLDHDPSNCDRANLKAMCAPCHLRYDAEHHARNRKINKRKKLEENGQLTLNLEV